MKFKNYIWDFDGTLFDTYPKMIEALKQAFIKEGLVVPDNLRFQILDTSVRDVIKKYVPQNQQGKVTKTYHQLEKTLQKDPQPFPKAKEVLGAIVKNDGANFLYTHRNQTAREILANHHLESYFNAIITSEAGFKRKPHPEGLETLSKKFHLLKEETVMVGDRKLDIEFGKNGNIQTIWFNSYQEPLGVISNFEIQTLSDILTIGG